MERDPVKANSGRIIRFTLQRTPTWAWAGRAGEGTYDLMLREIIKGLERQAAFRQKMWEALCEVGLPQRLIRQQRLQMAIFSTGPVPKL